MPDPIIPTPTPEPKPKRSSQLVSEAAEIKREIKALGSKYDDVIKKLESLGEKSPAPEPPTPEPGPAPKSENMFVAFFKKTGLLVD